MNEREMFEKSFERPTNYFKLSERRQWEIDKQLGILDWKGEGLADEDKKRFRDHYKNPHCCERMEYYINMRCLQHKSPFDCPDNVIHFSDNNKNKEKTYGIIIHDGGPSYYKINYCPWCGKGLVKCKKKSKTK